MSRIFGIRNRFFKKCQTQYFGIFQSGSNLITFSRRHISDLIYICLKFNECIFAYHRVSIIMINSILLMSSRNIWDTICWDQLVHEGLKIIKIPGRHTSSWNSAPFFLKLVSPKLHFYPNMPLKTNFEILGCTKYLFLACFLLLASSKKHASSLGHG